MMPNFSVISIMEMEIYYLIVYLCYFAFIRIEGENFDLKKTQYFNLKFNKHYCYLLKVCIVCMHPFTVQL